MHCILWSSMEQCKYAVLTSNVLLLKLETIVAVIFWVLLRLCISGYPLYKDHKVTIHLRHQRAMCCIVLLCGDMQCHPVRCDKCISRFYHSLLHHTPELSRSAFGAHRKAFCFMCHCSVNSP